MRVIVATAVVSLLIVGACSEAPLEVPGGTTCAVDLLCLAPKPVGTGRTVAGHLMVVWFQFNDDKPVEPAIAYHTPLAAGATRVDIPLSAIAPPRADLLLRTSQQGLCSGPSPDLKVGTAAVVVTPAPVTAADLNHAEFTGLGWLLLAYSPQRHIPAPCPYEALFPQGIDKGVKPYSVVHPATGFDQAGLPAPGTVFDVNVCSEDAVPCQVRGPNFS